MTTYNRQFARRMWRQRFGAGMFKRRFIPLRIRKGAFGEKTAFQQWKGAA